MIGSFPRNDKICDPSLGIKMLTKSFLGRHLKIMSVKFSFVTNAYYNVFMISFYHLFNIIFMTFNLIILFTGLYFIQVIS